MRIAVVLAAILATSPVFATEFDTMLAGYENGCMVSDELQQLWRGSRQVGEAQRNSIPASLTAGLDAPSVEDADDHFIVHFPVRDGGTWKGVSLQSLGFVHGKDNGISVLNVVFRNHAEAEPVFTPLAENSAAIMAADPENEIGATTEFGFFQGKSQYYCDFSN